MCMYVHDEFHHKFIRDSEQDYKMKPSGKNWELSAGGPANTKLLLQLYEHGQHACNVRLLATYFVES